MIEALLTCLSLLPIVAPFAVFIWLVIDHRRRMADLDAYYRERRKIMRRKFDDQHTR